MRTTNLVQSGILNNVESYLTQLSQLSKQADFPQAKKIITEMIQSYNISPKRKQKLLIDLNYKKSLNDILFFAYNMNLSAEGLRV